MSEKPYQKPEDGVVLKFRDHAPQGGSRVEPSQWVGTDLARFAQDVVALNSRTHDAAQGQRCQVASLESLQRGLKIKKPAEEKVTETAAAVNLSSFRKE